MIEKVRCKMKVTSITEFCWDTTQKKVTLSAQYDPSIPEDLRFQSNTPCANLEANIQNPAALEILKNGRDFYVDLIPVESITVKVGKG